MGVRIFFLSHRPVGVALRCGYVGGYPPYGSGPGGFPRPGGASTDGAVAAAEVRQDMGLHLGGGGERGGGVQANGDLHLELAEYGRAVYCDVTNSGPVQGGGEESGVTGRYVVVVKVGH